MARIGFHASHEQFPPSELLERQLVSVVPCRRITSALGPAQGNSGFAWAWLGAVLQATDLPFRVISAPGYRYDTAILAQAAATLCEMFPGRLWLALGSG